MAGVPNMHASCLLKDTTHVTHVITTEQATHVVWSLHGTVVELWVLMMKNFLQPAPGGKKWEAGLCASAIAHRLHTDTDIVKKRI